MTDAYVKCPTCNGSGLTSADFTGEPTECYVCKGDTVVRNRDDKGRFVGDDNPPWRGKLWPAGNAKGD